jgi:hypothetical protein
VDHFDVDGRGHTLPQATGACRNGQLGKCITESVQDFNGLHCRFTAGLRYLPSVLALSSLRTRTDGTNTPLPCCPYRNGLDQPHGLVAVRAILGAIHPAKIEECRKPTIQVFYVGNSAWSMIKDLGPTPACQRRAR